MARLKINKQKKLSKINAEIYGHFSEHLGRCIYEGIYVGENSPIPNVNGMRCDVVEALKHIKYKLNNCYICNLDGVVIRSWEDANGSRENW